MVSQQPAKLSCLYKAVWVRSPVAPPFHKGDVVKVGEIKVEIFKSESSRVADSIKIRHYMKEWRKYKRGRIKSPGRWPTDLIGVNPISFTISGCNSVGRMLDLGSSCRVFESRHSDHLCFFLLVRCF